MSRLFLFLISFFFQTSHKNNMLAINKAREGLSIIVYKIMMSIIIMTATLYSLTEFIFGIKNIMSSSENVLFYNVLVFGSFFMISLFSLSFLLKGKSKKTDSFELKKDEYYNFREIGIDFAQGILEGYNSYEPKNQESFSDEKQNKGKK